MRSNYKKLGPYIQEINERNTDLEVDLLLGVSIEKKFIPSIANTVGTDMSRYKIVRRNQFAYGPVTSRNGDKISIALLEDHNAALISQSYKAFEVIDHDELMPEYLMMWFRREEFDRYARYMSHGSTRETFDWDEMCDVELPIPSIEKQREIVAEYNAVVERIELNETINQKLEETAKAIYRHWFEDFEFPISKEYAESIGKPELEGKPYKSNGGEMVYSEELDKEIPTIWKLGTLSKLVDFSEERIPVGKLTKENYISTSNMLPERGGIEESSSLPNLKTVTKFNKNDILISNIRPYFKKIWLSTCVGGCSNDILCFVPKENINSLYIYFLLENDYFFDYVMRGAKGTKMPRGDKKWITNFPLAQPKADITNRFSSLTIYLNRFNEEKNDESELLISLSKILLSKMSVSKKQLKMV